MSKTFIKDPREVVKPGDVVRVKVMEVDKARKRISLSLRLDDQPGADAAQAGPSKGAAQAPKKMSAAPKGSPETGGGAFADAFRRAGMGK
jgi:uncharacterized protein